MCQLENCDTSAKQIKHDALRIAGSTAAADLKAFAMQFKVCVGVLKSSCVLNVPESTIKLIAYLYSASASLSSQCLKYYETIMMERTTQNTGVEITSSIVSCPGDRTSNRLRKRNGIQIFGIVMVFSIAAGFALYFLRLLLQSIAYALEDINLRECFIRASHRTGDAVNSLRLRLNLKVSADYYISHLTPNDAFDRYGKSLETFDLEGLKEVMRNEPIEYPLRSNGKARSELFFKLLYSIQLKCLEHRASKSEESSEEALRSYLNNITETATLEMRNNLYLIKIAILILIDIGSIQSAKRILMDVKGSNGIRTTGSVEAALDDESIVSTEVQTLKSELITKLENFLDALDGNCAICLNPLRSSDVPLLLNCLHLYHEECINTWLTDHDTCPVCKTADARSSDIKINLADLRTQDV